MKTLIAIPCMDVIEADFTDCLTELLLHHNPGEIEVKYLKASLVYDARNQLAKYVRDRGCFDYVLWLDSDMTFEPDLLDRLLEDIEGRQAVSGLCFGRRPPFRPCIFKRLEVDFHASAHDFSRTGVQNQVRDLDLRLFRSRRGTAQKRPDTGEKLGYGKRFCQIIVSARLKACDLVFD